MVCEYRPWSWATFSTKAPKDMYYTLSVGYLYQLTGRAETLKPYNVQSQVTQRYTKLPLGVL